MGQVLPTVVPRILQPCKSLICITFCISDLSSSFSHCVEVLVKKDSGSNSDFLFVHTTTNRACHNVKWHSFFWTLYNTLFHLHFFCRLKLFMLYHDLVEKKIYGVCTYVSNLQRHEWFPLHHTSRPALDPPPAYYFLGTCGRSFLMHNVTSAWSGTIHFRHVPDMTS